MNPISGVPTLHVKCTIRLRVGSDSPFSFHPFFHLRSNHPLPPFFSPPPSFTEPLHLQLEGDIDTHPNPLNIPSTVHSSAPLSLKVYSLNAKGLNIPEKHISVLAEAHRHRAQVIFLQETHFKLGSAPRLSNSRFLEVYHATYAASKTKGVSILIEKSHAFCLADRVVDPQGR